MANKMLIDASHPEETRVVVLRGNRVEEFDFESASKKQLRGNIYLAKVTRVEPSLQAAFVEYGGNRHGFLAFSEIHPDYYQIPHADRAALLEEEIRAHREEDEEDSSRRRSRRSRRGAERRRNHDDERVTGEFAAEDEQAGAVETDEETVETAAEVGEPVPAEAVAAEAPVAEAPADEARAQQSATGESAAEEAPAGEAPAEKAPEWLPEDHELASDPEGFAVVESGEESAEAALAPQAAADRVENGEENGESQDEAAEDDEARARDFLDLVQQNGSEAGRERETRARKRSQGENENERENEGENGEHEEEESVELLGGDAMDETHYRAPRLRRQYKIQEVIKRRQVLLIQVVKEERGNKGAALTTYLSLAGRYSVLMPNTARGGGISRKITDVGDRKRLKEIAQDLDVPEGMGVILRTAGASRTKQEIQRDFEYLMRMWEQVRELTLTSSAPALVYEEGSLIKRAIRDLYNKDIDEVVVAGENGHREARDFMRLLMPSHVKNVHHYRDPQPIFAKWGAESQLDALFHNQVTLKSGGYLVINQTEALVAIDVNSGRSTREHNIEDTALRTNLEASDEVARQLRLRDLAGLIVVDFIDMEESRNNRAVERRLKEALKDDRARIQVGRISHFGLLEMSRQRIRTGVLEGSSVVCPHCAGAGTVRSTASVAVHVMRVLEDALIKSASHNIVLRTRTDIALYILNHKRSLLRLIEERFGVSVTIAADDSLTGGAYHTLERGEPAVGPSDPARRFDPRRPIEDIEPIGDAELEAEFEEEAEIEAQEFQEAQEAENADERGEDTRRRRRRRRGRGRGFERESVGVDANAPQPSDEGLETVAEIAGDLVTAVAEEDGAENSAREGGEERRRGRGAWRRRNRSRSGAEIVEFAGDWRKSAESGEGTSDEAAAADEGGDALIETLAETRDFPPLPTWNAEPHPVAETPEAVAPADEAVAPAEREAKAETPVQETPVQEALVRETPARETPAQEAEAPSPLSVVPSAPNPDEPAHAAEPAQPELPVITAADPNMPKRSGWWARAKANLTGR
ncbi:Rne/Rng family ribonuclease [Rhodoblastus acidophilus]|uniref:Ribonuclease E n=1 Tax=Candidatus Rhodoblastus alkanivorans TaxID=2954117 RepID=A0ABS9Z6Q8_9HYPH|nr:Rne/Rng family ribonuclease [Candidatus Rhodoblastus alkanivorans]MCI4679563.1 Rne/Rng family ribonuclease [Candidatus Rhodoblastus alkanivorans]MCI4683314.1 Rne/Rng family ribonuclease [Candidatus Rhodoblastus alkanivorans]MDI4640627.1 Rne/Rng family ribonuclease [Rhodoblastus acidophilus]